MDEPPELVDALRHEPALRRLAWALHLGAADADDAVQHALTQAALGKRPADMPLGTFLRATLRYHAFNLMKLARRRRRREAAVAKNEPVPSTATIVARDLLRRRVADAVLALDDPYRTTVWLRWFEGLDVAGVAERMQVPANTARTRLQRAHARLKQQLDRDHGDREWGLLAAPIALFGAAAHASAVKSLSLAGAAALLLAGLVVAGVVVTAPDGDVAPTEVAAVAEPVPRPLVPAVEPLAPRPVAKAPVVVVDPAVVEVLDSNGQPAANLPVWWWHDDRPRWTEPPSGRSRFGAAVETTGEPLPEPTPLRTDARGRVALPARSPAAMTVEIASGLWFSVRRPGARVVLPETCEVSARLAGAPRGTAWEASCRFAEQHAREWRSAAGVRFEARSTSGSGVIRFQSQRTVARSDETVRVVVPAYRGWSWQLDASCYGFEIASESPPPRQAPFDVEFRVGRRLPCVHVAVREPGGALTALPGTVRMRAGDHAQRRPLADGRAVFAVPHPIGPKPDVRVLLADGRAATAVTDLGGSALERQLSVQIVDTRAPLRIRLRDVLPGEIWRVLLSGKKGWSRIDPASDEDAVGADVVYGLYEGWLWIAGVTEVRNWQVAITARNGRVALVSTSLFGDGEAWWWKSAPPADVSLAALFAECGRRPSLRAELAIGLPSDDGGHSFQTLWSHDQPLDGEDPPVWRAMTLPLALPLRLRVLDASRANRPVLLERSALR